MDGADNKGDFAPRVIEVQITNADWIDEGDDYNYYGKAVKTVEVKLKAKVL